MPDKQNNKKIDVDSLEMKARDAKIVRRIVMITFLVIIIVILIGGWISYAYLKSALKPIDENNEEQVIVEIPLGSSTSNIAIILQENNLIKNDKIFKFYAKFKNYSDFQAGEYSLSQSDSLEEILQELQTGKVMEEPQFKFAIPEGKAVEEIAEIVEADVNIPAKNFLKQARDEAYLKSLIEAYPLILDESILDDDIIEPLEGYLFSATYDVFEETPTADSVIKQMLDKTNEVISEYKDDIKDEDLSVQEIITLASMVERESKFSEDRPKVAQVFLNRLEDDMKLQSDITAAYAMGEHKIWMSYADIEVDSPYNTYVREGLPPGPIASPSLEAIDAVVHPEGQDFTELYFYARPSGETFYSKSLDEHNVIVEKYDQEWKDLEKESKEKDKGN